MYRTWPLENLIGLPCPESSMVVVPLMVRCLLWPRGVDESVFSHSFFGPLLVQKIHCIAECECASHDQNIIRSARDLD